jgi:L-rhamnonate dehydratase
MQVKGEPVFNLMGGRTKQRVPCYATTSRPDLAKGLGFHGAKVPLPYGPSDGQEGMSANIKVGCSYPSFAFPALFFLPLAG